MLGCPQMTTAVARTENTTTILVELRAAVEKALEGKPEVIELALTALLAEGHVLIEDVPGVGKTTLCFELAAILKRRDMRVDMVKEVARSCPLPLNRDTTLEAQAWILHTQIAREIEAMVHHDVIVCDRALLDNYAYLVHKFGRIHVFDELVASWMASYGLLVKVPIVDRPRFDGVRDTGADYQREIDGVIESLLKEFRIDCVRLPSWSRDSWVDQVVAALPLGGEQLGLFDDPSAPRP